MFEFPILFFVNLLIPKAIDSIPQISVFENGRVAILDWRDDTVREYVGECEHLALSLEVDWILLILVFGFLVALPDVEDIWVTVDGRKFAEVETDIVVHFCLYDVDHGDVDLDEVNFFDEFGEQILLVELSLDCHLLDGFLDLLQILDVDLV